MTFSLNELISSGNEGITPPEYIYATDGVALAIRSYVPEDPAAVLLFYHGGGAHGGAGYHHLGTGLRDDYKIAVYTVDIRGHGMSGGRRGDSPSTNQVWKDVSTAIEFARSRYPSLPVFLGGHSSGAGLVLNYLSMESDNEVSAYVFVSPNFGFRSETSRPRGSKEFSSTNVRYFILHALSKGLLYGHRRAVRFNYPREVLENDPRMVDCYTVNMAKAVTPFSPREQFNCIDRPVGLWIGSEDELIDPEKVIAFAAPGGSRSRLSEIAMIKKVNHASMLLCVHEKIGSWIESCL
ncbi:alpha-beta hydrolase superfamily lysophospholipase [Desulfosalsimonas propionicica]|uniref:Alpha-beta hydrolase superfamily lysophospholipase n=1 Tax=Desulfosalsimonas propionicica TaxID=332175 RepID=A0A7W0HL43_9BACT|nr:alpha/beta fold hydrolase [Desulfosalsimonas propionicica]MBA2881870.1 alpha-beta hydrolase superfamily lysophospholipase [Desulfosalsimonas propionicica]